MADALAPLQISIQDIRMKKYDGSDEISIMAQFFELGLYPSVYEMCMLGTLTILDTINLLTNYPMVGEETITITFKPTRHAFPTTGDEVRTNDAVQTIVFVVDQIKKIKPDDNLSSQLYNLHLVPPEVRLSSKLRLQKAYKDTYTKSIQNILQNELKVDPIKLGLPVDTLFERSRGIHHVVVPNMYPLEACAWMAGRAVSLDTSHGLYWLYQNIYQEYNFKTYGSFLDSINPSDVLNYTYITNMSDSIRRNFLQVMKIPEQNVFTGLSINSRFDTSRKTVSGYFEREYFEIDIFNRKVNLYDDYLPLEVIARSGVTYNNMNSNNFITATQNQNSSPGTKNRVRYRLAQNNGDDASEPSYAGDKFVKAAGDMSALAQVELTASLPGDTRLQPGDVINLKMPDIHGFSKVEEDYMLTGYYIVTDISHTITKGMQHVMSVNLAKSGFNQLIGPMKYK